MYMNQLPRYRSSFDRRSPPGVVHPRVGVHEAAGHRVPGRLVRFRQSDVRGNAARAGHTRIPDEPRRNVSFVVFRLFVRSSFSCFSSSISHEGTRVYDR